MIVAVVPRPTNSVASSTAEVDLPTPPFELAKEMVGIFDPVPACFCRTQAQLSSVCQLTTIAELTTKRRQLPD
jgi:hypothetical protein